MNDTFDDLWFDRVLQDVDATTPAELRTVIGEMVSQGHQTAASMTSDTSRPRWLMASVAVAIVALVAGLVLLSGLGGKSTSVPSDVGTDVDQSSSTVSIPESTIAQDVVAPGTTPTDDAETPSGAGGVLGEMGLRGAVTLSGDEAVAALAVLNNYRIGVLRASPGFSATSASGESWAPADGSTPPPDDPATVADVTVLANGDVWAEFANGDVFWHEGATGIGRQLFTGGDGSPLAWETGTFPNEHNFRGVIGHDPLELITPIEGFRRWDTVEVSTTEFEQGDAVEVRIEYSVRDGEVDRERYVVDLTSGLIVVRDSTYGDATSAQTGRSSLSDVTVVDGLPVDSFPALPDGLEWTQIKDPWGGQRAVGIDEASAAFGSGLVLPRAALDAGVIGMEHSGLALDGRVVGPDDPDAGSRSVMIRYIEPVGLLRTTVSLYTERPGPGGTIPPDYVQIDDRLCLGSCMTTAADPGQVPLVTPDSGALAGISVYDWGTNFDGIGLQITAPTQEEASAIANTFVAVRGS